MNALTTSSLSCARTHACIHSHAHACTHAFANTHTHTRTTPPPSIPPPRHTQMHTHTQIHTHTHSNTRAHAHRHKQKRARTHAQTNARHVQTLSLALPHARSLTRTHAPHARTHAHTRSHNFAYTLVTHESTRTHTAAAAKQHLPHTTQMEYSGVSPGVGMRHLEGPENPDGLNLGICIFVYVYKVRTCVYRVILGHRKWQIETAAWNLDVRLDVSKETLCTPKNVCLETRWLGHFGGFCVPG